MKSSRILFDFPNRLFLWVLLVLFGCQSHLSKVGPETFDHPSFEMRASNLLFFRNTRSYYYVRLADTLQPLEVYRWRGFAARPHYPQIQPLLLINTLNDRAVMLLCLRLPNGTENHDFRLFVSHSSAPEIIDTLSCRRQDPPLNHHRMLARLYRAIENQENIECMIQGRASAIFTNEKERSDFELQVRDYLRLTGAYD